MKFVLLTGLAVFFGACSRSPEFVVHDQVLEWPVLDEVRDISSQLTYHSGTYFLAGEKSLFSVSDTNAATKAKLLYRFDDSLWTHYSQLWHPGRTIKKPAELEDDWFRGMSDFYIENIEAIDSNNLLLFLKFNVSVRNIDQSGGVFNGHVLTFQFNINLQQLTPIPYDGYFEKTDKKLLITCGLSQHKPIKIVRRSENIVLYSSECFHYAGDSNYNLPSGELIRYRLDQTEPDYYLLDTMKEIHMDYEQIMVKDSSLIGIDGAGPHHIMKLDTSVIKNMYPTNAVYFPNSKFPILLKALYKPNGTRDIEISRIIDKKTQQLIWSGIDITVFSHDMYTTTTGELVYFYETEGQIHQLTISRK